MVRTTVWFIIFAVISAFGFAIWADSAALGVGVFGALYALGLVIRP